MGRKSKTTNRAVIGNTSFDLDNYNARIDRSGDCWPWTGARHVQGYGFLSVRKEDTRTSTMTVAHRVAMMLKLDRELTRDEYIIHTCDNPLCANPDHLELTDKMGKSQFHIDLGKYVNRGATNTGLVKQNRQYRYTDDDMRWIRSASTADIAAKYNVTKHYAGKLRWALRQGYKWLD